MDPLVRNAGLVPNKPECQEIQGNASEQFVLEIFGPRSNVITSMTSNMCSEFFAHKSFQIAMHELFS